MALLVDIFLRYYIFEYQEDDGVISNSVAIKNMYKKKWLKFDFSAAFPLDLMYIIVAAALKIEVNQGIWIHFRLNKFIRWSRLSSSLKFLEHEIPSKNEVLWRFSKLLLLLLLAAHMFGCLFYLVPIYFPSPDGVWTDAYPGLTVGEQYVLAMYWSIQTLGYIGINLLV